MTELPHTYLAMQLAGVGERLRPIELPLRDPEPGEALVQVEACGVCGSDLFLQGGGFGPDRYPVVPGHEAAGRVRAVGDSGDSWLIGKQVALYYIHSHHESTLFEEGHVNVGPGIERMGVDVDGAFAEYVIRPVTTLIPVSPELDPAVVAVATDALATPFHALTSVARLRAGETLVVIGVGGVGSNAVQIGKLLGARVVAVGRSRAKLEQALQLGADAAIPSSDGVAAVQLLAQGNIDVVIECSGVKEMARFAIDCAGYRGRVVLVGASTESITLTSTELIWRELAVLGSRGFTPSDIETVLEHIKSGKLTTGHLTGSTRPLSQANEALEDLKAGRTMRTILIPGATLTQIAAIDPNRSSHDLAK